MTAAPVSPDDGLEKPQPIPSVDSQPLAAGVRKGALWSVASNVLLKLSGMLVTAIVAHILHPQDFGVFAVATTAYTIVSSLSELGASSCLVRADLSMDSLAPTVATVSFVTNALFAGAMAIFARPIAGALGAAGAASAIRVMAIAVLLVGVFAVPTSHLMRDLKQDKLFLANLISFVPSTALLLILAKTGDGAMALAWSRVLGQLVVGIMLVAYVPRFYRPGLAREALSILVKFGLPLAGANFVNYILLNVDYVLVGHLLGAVLLGIYVLAFNVASWPGSLLGNMINNVSIPAFSRVKHDPELLRPAIVGAVRAITLVVMPTCCLLLALARPIVLTLYGHQWTRSATVLAVLAAYGAISIICVLFANMIASLGRTKWLFGLQIIWLAALVPAMAYGVHLDGIVGAAMAHIVVIAPIVLPSYLIALKRVTGVRLLALAKAALPATLAALVAAFAANRVAAQSGDPLVQLIAGGVAGGLLYALLVAPQLLAVASHGRALGQRARRVIRAYTNAARAVGIPAGPPPRHSARAARQRGRPEPRHHPHAGRPALRVITNNHHGEGL